MYKKQQNKHQNQKKCGCEITRVACLDEEDARAIKEIKKKIHIPIVADIHFDYKIALTAIEAGVDKLRINPGNIGGRDRVEAVVKACKERKIPIRIGVNSGSIEQEILDKYNGKPTADRNGRKCNKTYKNFRRARFL